MAASLLGAVQAAAEGRLAVEGSSTKYLGDFPSSERQTVQFHLRNTGDTTVGIKAVSKSCSCADADVSTQAVEAGKMTVVTLTTLPDTLVGQFCKSVYVITTATDPRFHTVKLTLQGRGIERQEGKQGVTVAEDEGALGSDSAVRQDSSEKDRLSSPAGEQPGTNARQFVVEFFVQEGCADCQRLRREVLPMLTARFGGRLRLIVSDTHEQVQFMRLLKTLEEHGITANEPVYMVVKGETVLSGLGEIKRRGIESIEGALSVSTSGVSANASDGAGSDVSHDEKEAISNDNDSQPAVHLFRRFGWLAVAAAGLSDGINPCAFATIVFLTSLLMAGGRKRRGVLLGGLSFCLASFATYFLIGLGLLTALRHLAVVGVVRMVVEYGTAACLAVLGVLSLCDAWRYRHTGDSRKVLVQLPEGIKRRIRAFALNWWGGPVVFATGFICGAGVTILESVCTGQMYLPTLVFMSREGGGSRAWSLLLLYNVMFIVPLFAVFSIGSVGVRSQRLVAWSRKNVVPSKVFLACVFFVLCYAFLARIAEI